MALSNYEREKEANIAKNRKKLEELELQFPTGPPVKLINRSKKRKVEVDEAEIAGQKPKVARVREPASGTRRSMRNEGKVVDYKAEQVERRVPATVSRSFKTQGTNDGPLGRETGKRTHNPKTYGSIPGIEVGTWWESRQGCSLDAIHAPWVGGISPGPQGAYSIALSGGYEDDVDLGEGFTYTGSGGRDLKGTPAHPKNLRTAPQSSDQTFDHNTNSALKKSSETGKPVRVIRGFKLRSKYAPVEGYRYDGLYTVEKAWLDTGYNSGGFQVCKFAFRRLPNQPALPQKGDAESESDD